MAKEPKRMSRQDESRLLKAARMMERAGKKRQAKILRGIVKARRVSDEQAAREWKQQQSDPYTRYDPNGPN
jgi:hypothetical protein